MTGFLTVEDVNTLIREYGGVNDYHQINTSLITDNDVDYEKVIYDFTKVSRKKLDNDAGYEFKFIVNNNRWTGWHYFTTVNGEYINSDASFDSSSKTITFVSSEQNIILILYCTSLHGFVSFYRTTKLVNDLTRSLTIDKFHKTYNAGTYTDLPTGQEIGAGIINIGDPGVFTWYFTYNEVNFFLATLIKTDFKFNCTYQPKLDKKNKIPLGVHDDYLPGGKLVQNYTPSLYVIWNDKILDVEYDEELGDYFFILDLQGIISTKSIKLSLIVEANKVLNHTVSEFTLVPVEETVDTFEELVAACNVGGANVIRLGEDITATSIIPINHSIKINGNEHVLDLNGYGFDLMKDVDVIIENVEVNNGDTCFLQHENTNLTINNSTFTNCTSTKYNQLGSIIFCEVTSGNLEEDTDFTTTITGTLFMNNHSCILHGGQLTIDNCKFLQNDIEYINTGNVAFLYQTDGTANITNSIFDIDYDTDNLCSNQIDIGYAQALLKIGETAIINGANINDLSRDNNLPFSNIYKNQSHVFTKYYYPSIESCVYTSPVPGLEDSNVCYCVSNLNWIFKQNTQVTRADAGTENRIRKIIWG